MSEPKKQCAGKNREGARCRRNAQPHADYCAFHSAPGTQKAPPKRQKKQPEPAKVELKLEGVPDVDWLIVTLSSAISMALGGQINSYAAKGVADLAKQLTEAYRLRRELDGDDDEEGLEDGEESDLASLSMEELTKLATEALQ